MLMFARAHFLWLLLLVPLFLLGYALLRRARVISDFRNYIESLLLGISRALKRNSARL